MEELRACFRCEDQVTGRRIKVSGVSLNKDGKLIKKPTYANVSDKLKRGDRKKIVKGKRIK